VATVQLCIKPEFLFLEEHACGLEERAGKRLVALLGDPRSLELSRELVVTALGSV
jgi:ABC-type branched-subunit amino acid transport system ATPase component